MKKYFFYTLVFVLFISFSAAAQNTSAQSSLAESALNSKAEALRLKFKVMHPTTDKTDQVEITGMGAATFTTSNIADGTTESYKHAQKISIALIPAGSKAISYQLLFYPESENIPYAATTDNGVVSIYYPLNLFSAIRGTLEQSFKDKKKVTVKVIQKTNGYREGTLVF